MDLEPPSGTARDPIARTHLEGEAPPAGKPAARREAAAAVQADPSRGEKTHAASEGESGESAAFAAVESTPYAASATPRSTTSNSTTSRREAAPKEQQATASGGAPDDEPEAVPPATAQVHDSSRTVLVIEGLAKRFDDTVAVAGIDLTVRTGSIFGIVGPNGAGKTTTLSMITGLLRPDSGRVLVHGADVWKDPVVAKRNMGVLPDRLRLFDRLTGSQLLYYSGTLRGLDRATVTSRSADLAAAFGLEDALERLVTDYSAGMTKKIALAAAMIHSPRILILDEPFEAVDPVSAANVIDILQKYAAAGGTVVMSSHSMDLIQRICDSVAIVVQGAILASGTMDEVCDGSTLEVRFVNLAGGRKAAEGMEWLHSFSD